MSSDTPNTPQVPQVSFSLSDEDKATLRDRETTATVSVEITPRDVAILSSLSQGQEQTDMADDYLCHRQTILKVVNRLYAKLGVSKAPHAVQVAGTAGAFKFTDGGLTLSDRQALYAADKSWAKVGDTPLRDTRTTPETDGETTNGVTTRQATPEEAEAMAADAQESQRQTRRRG
jgi:DNA-binding CsgD family transcriptional regulator